jgi:PAS domain S-box-containing protein
VTADSSPRHDNLDHEVAVEQARLLFRDTVVGVVASAMLAVVLAVIFYPYIGALPTALWLAALMATIGLRLLVLRHARAVELTSDNVRVHVRRAIWAASATGAAWGALILMAYPQLSASLQFLFALVIVGMLAGAVAVYAGSFATWLAFCAPITVATMVMLFRSTDPESGRLFVLMGAFAIIVAIMAYRSVQVLSASLRLGLDNRGLVQRLTLARDNAENLYHQNLAAYARLENAEAVLRDKAQVLERQARALNSAANAIFVLEQSADEQRIVYANPAAARLTGRAIEQLVGANLSAVLRFHDKIPNPEPYGLRGMEREVVLCGRRADGAEFWTEPTIAAVSAGTGGPAQSVMVLNDITARVTAEQALRELSSHLLTVREEEMSRIAREVHDEIGSLLTGLKMDLGWVRQRVASRDPLLAEKCQAMMRLADSTLDATRRISTGLRPLALDHLGIGAAIEDYAAGFSARTGIACNVDVVLDGASPDAAQAIALFRIVQEGLTNVARHARAHAVGVTLELQDDAFLLTVTDDGVGIGSPAGGMPRAALGVRGMRERAYALGGELTVERGTDGGTVLAARIPVARPDYTGGDIYDQNINRG